MKTTCAKCKWVGCRNYGWERTICSKYIPEVDQNKSVSSN